MITYPESKAPRDVNTALLVFLLVMLSPLLIAVGFIVYIWTRFRGAPASPPEGCSLERSSGVKTMSEVMEILEWIKFRSSFPGAMSSAASIIIDLVPSALATTRITAGLIYPYPPSFEPVMLESQDGTPVCGHLAMQLGGAKRPALILASGAAASKNSGWMLSLALKAYYDWGFHVLALDLRNRGDSGRFSDAPTSWGYRESYDVLAAADYLDSLDVVSTVGVCGAGMAGSAALLAAGRSRPDRPLEGGIVAVGAYSEAAAEVARLAGKGYAPPAASLRRLLGRVLLFIKTLSDGPRAFFDPRSYTR